MIDDKKALTMDEYALIISHKAIELCLVEILNKAYAMETAREVRHLIKDYILYGYKKEEGKK